MEALSNIAIISILITSVLSAMAMTIPLEISQDVKNKKAKENFDKWIAYLVEEDKKKREKEWEEKYPIKRQIEILREIWKK